MQSLLGIPALVVIGSSVWVGADASQRDLSGDRFADRTWKWVVGCLLLWIVAFPIYLARRNRSPIQTTGRRRGKIARRTRSGPVFWWGIASVAALTLGAFGPWVRVLGISVNGTDGSNDGWIVAGIALVALLCVLAQHRTALLPVVGLLAGLSGVAITLYDRHHLTTAIDDAGVFGSLAGVGWGLNLALAASASVAVQALAAARHVLDQTPTTAPSRPMKLAADGGLNLRHKSAVFGEAGSGEDAIAPDEQQVGAPAGWYVDPRDPQRLRYWTGDSWSDATARVDQSVH
jgi:hypothetical protein